VKDPIFNIGEKVYYYNKWNNEIEKGEITNIRQANLNWDYTIRYYIQADLIYYHWIEEKYISRDDQTLFKYL